MNYQMTANFFGKPVRAETEGTMVCLTDIVNAGRQWRAVHGLSELDLRQLQKLIDYEPFKVAVAKEYGVPIESLEYVAGKGNKAHTMGHVALAVWIAERMSPEFHAKVIKEFVEGRLLQYRALGGTEFKSLNAAIATHLPDRIGKDNQGVYIQVAKALRKKILDDGDWATATAEQTHQRYEQEAYLSKSVRMGVIRDYPHLKEVIEKL